MAEPRGERIGQAGEARLAAVESIRGLALICVITGHLWAMSKAGSVNGFELALGTLPRRIMFCLTYGVWVFFGLSGYLLFWPFVRRQLGRGGPISVRTYATNRAVRILPLYYVAVVVGLLFLADDPTLRLWWRHLIGAQGLWHDSSFAVNGPLWSVAIELQFYALLPILAWLLAKVAGRSYGRTVAILVVLGAASAIARQLLAIDVADWTTTLWRFQLPTTFCFFATGMLLAVTRARLEERPLTGPLAHPGLWLAAAAPLWLAACADARLSLELLCIPAVFLTVGGIVLPLRPWAPLAAMRWRPLALLGVVSYSVYVWHWPAIFEIGWIYDLVDDPFVLLPLVYFPALIVIGVVSYWFLERPGLRMRRRWANESPAPIGSPAA
jgi:peptidoglycan/LPS O-acetylase OafA/YrhL